MPFSPRASGCTIFLHRKRGRGLRQLAGFVGAYVLIAAAVWGGEPDETQADSVVVNARIGEESGARSGYVGDAVCASCHAETAAHFHDTAHARTSALASGESIRGLFAPGRNQLRTGNPNLYFQMAAKDGQFTETAVVRTSPSEAMARTEKIDLVIGSGRKGQTYLFWDEDRLYQLPVSFWTGLNQWANSPGYADGFANFERPIDSRCLECHASAFEAATPPINRFRRSSLVLGISCEKCHGPGEAHAALHAAGAKRPEKISEAMVNPAKLSRDRQMDLCALCHAGIGNSITPPGTFQAGATLSEHLSFPATDPAAPIDVHASQVELLERSRCFRSSATMTCSTCHDVHHEQRDLTAMAARCLSCHKTESCGEFHAQGMAIATRCVTCHMPLQKTSQIVSVADGQTLQPTVRNHRIAVYSRGE